MPTKLYDVLIVRSSDNHVEAVTGRNLTERAAERREYTTIGRIAVGDYFVATAPAGKFEKGARYSA